VSTCFLLAPGPSASQALADQLRGRRVGVCTSAFPLAPWAEFLVATDLKFWSKYPEARTFAGRRFTPNRVSFAEKVSSPVATAQCNSGVVGLEVWRRLGATRVVMLGFDFRTSHYFGDYTNGLANTAPTRRKVHEQQFKVWKRAHGSKVEVLNATPDSALTVFPRIELEEALAL
jgi:hypothetical protein